MKRSAWIVGLALLLATGCTTVNLESEKAALAQREREWSQSTKDVNRFMTFVAPNATMYTPGMPALVGSEAIRKFATEMMNTPGVSLSFNSLKTEVAASGDVGYTTGTYTMSMGPHKEVGKYVTVWRKEGGTWMAVEDIFNADAPPVAPAQHAMVPASTITWTDAPPMLPAGAKGAVIVGDPTKEGPFVVRLQVPAGYQIPMHWHPTTENVSVLSGTISIGTDDATKPPTDLPAGSFMTMPAQMRHVFNAKTAATIQIHGTGPFTITYVNAADDPRNKK